METYNSIEVTKQLVKDGKISQEIAETIFPELKESEDERIRKGLINYFNDFNLPTFGGLDPKKILAWLEKQGEQNPKSADFIPTDCTSDAKNENRWHKVEDSLPDNAREVLCKDAIGNFFIGRYYNDGDYWEVSMYDEPDKSNKDNPPVIMWMNIPSCEQNLANSEKTCKDEQNPAWSEEDEGIVSQIMTDLENCESEWGSNKGEEKAWLESLKGRVQPQPKSEWSEEDEKTTQRIVDTIMKYAISPHSIINGDKPNLEYAKEFESWLKSLKFRIQPQWKPSDEQMEYLAKAITTLGNEGDNKTSAILCELRADLKKLIG